MRHPRLTLVLSLLLAALAAPACEHDLFTDPTPQAAPVQIIITPVVGFAFVGQTHDFHAQVIGGDASTNRQVTWSSSTPAIATITPSGLTGTARCHSAGFAGFIALNAHAVGNFSLRCEQPPPVPAVPLLELRPASITFEHIVGTTRCPQFVVDVAITNVRRVPLTVNLRSGHQAITLSGTRFQLQPDQNGGFSVNFNCGVAEPFTTEIDVTAQAQDGTSESVRVPVTANIRR